MHLPWSPGLQNDDRLIQSLDGFEGKRVIVTEKFDGENATLYPDHYHARSLDSRHHPSRDWIKAFHASIKQDIPEGYRICGENMYAKHSIFYDQLPSYFLGFSIWDQYNNCIPWDETVELFELIGIEPVTVLYDGSWEVFRDGHEFMDQIVADFGKEGYVVRIADQFAGFDFKRYVAKYVRKDHIQTDEHWMQSELIPNVLR